MTWRDAAAQFIAEQAAAHPEIDRDALRKYCSQHYPFAQRSGWAYKAFLAAMRERFGSKSTTRAAEKRGQGSLQL